MAEHRQWEYYVETVGSAWKGTSDETLFSVFTALGQAGWEVFSVEQIENSNKVRIVAKRPVAGPIRRRSTWPG